MLSFCREHTHCTCPSSFNHLLLFDSHSVDPVILSMPTTPSSASLAALIAPVCKAVKFCQPTAVAVLTTQACNACRSSHNKATIHFVKSK